MNEELKCVFEDVCVCVCECTCSVSHSWFRRTDDECHSNCCSTRALHFTPQPEERRMRRGDTRTHRERERETDSTQSGASI